MRKAFPQALRAYLADMPVHTGIVWQSNGIPQIIIKLYDDIDFHSAPLVCKNECYRDAHARMHLTGLRK